MSTLKKALSYSVVLTTIVWSVGLLATPIAVGAATGDLVKLHCPAGAAADHGCKAVFYVGADGKRYVFPNEKAYKTWYANFSGVREVSTDELNAIVRGTLHAGNVTYRPGVKLIKSPSSSWVYAVAANGTLRHVPDGAVLVALYGSTWPQQVDDVSDSWIGTYNVGADITAAAQYDKGAEQSASTSISADFALCTGTDCAVSTGSRLTASLSPDSPGATTAFGGTIFESAARVPMTKVALTAGADGDIIINSLTVANSGAASDTTYSSIDILDGDTMLPFNRTGKTFNSDHQATFGDDITVRAGTTRYVWLAGNFGSSLDSAASETPRLSLVAIDASGASVSGLPVTPQGVWNINATTSIGSATVQRGAFVNASDTSLEVGTTNYSFFSIRLQNDSNDSDVEFQNLRIEQIGSASLGTDLTELKMFQDATELATGVVKAGDNKYMDFHLATPKVIPKGQSIQLVIRGKVADGSGRTIQLGIERSTDLLVKSTRFNQNVTPTYSGNGSGSSSPVMTDNQHTISAGTMTVSKTNDVPATDIAVGNDQDLGSFKFEVRGEPIDITQLVFTVNTTTASATANKQTAVKSIRLIDSAGKVLNGPDDIVDNASTVTFSGSMTLKQGDNIIKVRANLGTNAGWATNDQASVSITPSSGVTGRGETTNNTITATPGSAITGNTQTIKAANLTVTRNSTPTDKTVIAGVVQESLGAWNFNATNSGEDIRITALSFAASTTNNVVALTLYNGSTKLLPVQDTNCSSSPCGAARTSIVTTTFVLSDPIIVKKGTQTTVTLKGDVSTASASGEAVAFGLTDGATASNSSVTAYGLTTGNEAVISNTASDGALITVATAGTLTIDKDASSLTSKRLAGGTSGIEIATIRLKATSEPIKVTRLNIAVGPHPENDTLIATSTEYGTFKSVSKAWLKLDGTTIGDTNGYPINATTTQIDLAQGVLTIPTGSSGKKLSIVVDTAYIGAPADNLPGIPNAGVVVGLFGGDIIVARGDSGASVTPTYNSGTSSQMIVDKSYPEVTKGTANSTPVSGASFYQAKIVAKNDDIAVYRLSFVVSSSSTSGTGIVSNAYLNTASNSCSTCNIGPNRQVAAIVAAGTYAGSDSGTTATNGPDLYSFTVDQTQTHGQDHLKIPAGQTGVIDFIASFASSAGIDNVSVSLLGDTATTTNNNRTGTTAAVFAALNQGNFVWSDLWRTITDPLNSAQWYNGFLVEGMQATGTPVTLSE